MKFRIILFAALLSLALSACISLAEDVTPPPGYTPPTPVPTLGALFPAAAPDAVNGAAIYAEKCAPCHGPTGLGDGPQASVLPVAVPALGRPEVARRASPAQWFTVVTQGNLTNFMPGFASLSDQERWDVVAYAHSLSTSPAEVEAGRAVYEANCALCHGPNGKSAPTADLTNLQWLASRSLDEWAASVSKGMAPAMPAFEGKLADADIYASLAYARTFAYTAPVAASGAEQAGPAPDPVDETETPAEGESVPAAPVETEAAEAASSGQVSGQISSGSGGVLPSGLKVVLHGFDHDTPNNQFNEVLTLEASVGADGRYLFENIDMPEGRAFYVSLDYAGTEYSSDAAFVQDGLTTFDLPIQVYESSADPSVLEISQAHVLLDFSTPDTVSVIHFLVIGNPTERTIVAPGEGQPVVSFSLPPEFSNLQFENGILGGRFLPTADGFGDTVNVLPGTNQYQLVFAYDLPYAAPSGFAALFGGGATDLSLPLTLPARSVTLLVPEGVTASGASLADGGLQSMGSGINFQMYRAGSLTAGQELAFKISGSPKSAATVDSASGNNQNILIGVGVLGLVLILVGGYLFWRDRRIDEAEDLDEDEEEDFDEEDDDEPEIDEDEILDAIVALDDQFKDGNIAEAAYRERRAGLKAKLR
jgi:mono/diheme cytochrome c family protein